MSRQAENSSPFSARVVGILLAVAIFSFGAVMVLAGWAPELRDRNTAGDHPYSTSAIGYNGLVQLLEAQGYPVRISRLERGLNAHGRDLQVVTLSPWGMDRALEEFAPRKTTLVVLPKWVGRPDPFNTKFQADTHFADAHDINDLLDTLEFDAEIGRIAVPEQVDTPFGPLALKPDVRMQVLRSDRLTPVVRAGDGMLLAYAPERDIYVLSDPDMVNTFGLAHFDNARFATGLFDYLRSDRLQPIEFDATLHGFVRSENLLQMMFDIPFLSVTLTALASAFLLGWAALVRFGPPDRDGRAIALGKQALADNSAGLITMARRETRMAPGYLHLIRRRVARDIGAPRTLTEAQLTDLFDRLGPEETSGRRFSEIAAGMEDAAANREELMQGARDLFRWRRGIIGRSMNERK